MAENGRGEEVKVGKDNITIRIDNRVIILIGVNSHSISDHTQSNWKGITGNICLYATPKVFIDDIKIFPDILKKNARVIISIKNPYRKDFKGKLSFQASSFNTKLPERFARKNVTIVTNSNEQQTVLDYKYIQ